MKNAKSIAPHKIDHIVVFGIGAAGSNTFLHLLYAYPNLNFTVVDFDTIESRNYDAGTQPYSKVDLNRPKTQALQRIAMSLKNKKINAITSKINSAKDIMALVSNPSNSLLIDCFDNADSRNLFIGLKAYNVLHIGFSANLCGEAVWDETFTHMTKAKADAEIDVCEMTIARPFIFALTSMAAMSISRFIEKSEKNNLYFDSHFIVRKF